MHGLLVNVLDNNYPTKIKLLYANQQGPFRELPRGGGKKHLEQTFRGCSAALPFLLIICQLLNATHLSLPHGTQRVIGARLLLAKRQKLGRWKTTKGNQRNRIRIKKARCSTLRFVGTRRNCPIGSFADFQLGFRFIKPSYQYSRRVGVYSIFIFDSL